MDNKEKFLWAKYFEAIEDDKGFSYIQDRFGGKMQGSYYHIAPSKIGADSWTFSCKQESYGLISHYGNDWHGRLIDFLQEFDGLNFEQAVQEVCEHYNVSLDQSDASPRIRRVVKPVQPVAQKPKELIKIEFGDFSDAELNYWKKRKISKKTLLVNNVRPIRGFEQFNPNTKKTWKKAKLEFCFAYNIEKQGDKVIGCHVKTPKMNLVEGSKDLQLGVKPKNLLGIHQLEPKLGFILVCYGIADYLSAVENAPQKFNFVDAKAEMLKLPKIITQTAQKYKLRVLAMPDTDFQGRRLAKFLPQNHKNLRILTAPRLEHQYFRKDKRKGWIDLDGNQVEKPVLDFEKPKINDLNDYIVKFGFDKELRNLIKRACFPKPKIKIANSIYLHAIDKEKADIPFVIFKLGHFEDGDFFDQNHTISTNNFNYFFNKKGLFISEIEDIIKDVTPRNFYFIYDWNTFKVNWNPDKDLAIKPWAIRKQISRLHTACAPHLGLEEDEVRNFWFATAKSQTYIHDWATFVKKKGTDNFIKLLKKEDARDNEIWYKLKLTTYSKEQINTFLSIDSPQRFYETYGLRKTVSDSEFIFQYGVYQCNYGEVEYVRHVDSDMFMFIMGRLMQKVQYIDDDTEVVSFATYPKENLAIRYSPTFINNLKHYDGFVNEPNFDGNYQQVVQKISGGTKLSMWNVALPIRFQPEKGLFPNTQKYMHHVFRGKATFGKHILGDRLTIALDWLKIALTNPKQKLPMMLLVSKEQGTGKSTLMDLLSILLGANAIKTNMNDLLGKFNSHNAYKKFIFLEEVKMEGEKAAPKDTLKEIITGPSAFMEPKGLPKQQIKNHKVLMAASNHETNIMKLEKEDSRWFVNKVEKVKEEDLDVDLLDKMVDELPQFLHYLLNDPIFHPKENRLWFHLKYIQTPEFWKIVEETKPLLDKSIEAVISETMLTYQLSLLPVCNEWLIPELKIQSGFNSISTNQVNKYFRERGIEKQNASFVKIPIDWKEDAEEEDEKYVYFTDKKTNKIPKKRFWMLNANDWLTTAQMKEMIKNPIDLKAKKEETPF